MFIPHTLVAFKKRIIDPPPFFFSLFRVNHASTTCIQSFASRAGTSIEGRQESVAKCQGVIYCHCYKEKETSSKMVRI